MGFLNDCIKSLSGNPAMSQKQELITRLNEKRKQVQLLVKPHKKQQAPKPPPRLDDSTPPNGVSPCFDLRPVVSQQYISEERESLTKSLNDSNCKGMAFFYNDYKLLNQIFFLKIICLVGVSI